ncbi:DUF4299 family protein [Streptococcus equinus]|uniref:Uncharacterized protein n=1 Tax=Streptococcus equinus TaxID=1335 RepID=A0AAE8HLY0_STREI|nr:DUF4299 family protein [Streptococcus equinus]SDW98363.1 protein of unknown function [Streptococcus equinus]SEQ16423.1 protein of unknown function [Streptococcus equinus]
MESIIFTINSDKILTIGDLLQSDIFECISVAAKDAQNTPSANSKISLFQSVLFAVRGKSTFGFRLSYESSEYQLSVSELATPSDWTGALMFLNMLLVILEVNAVQSQGKTFTRDSILDYHFTPVLLKAISKLVKELQVHPGVQLSGIRRPIFINQNYFGQIINVPDDQFLDSYDKRLGLTQQINAYFSEQQVFKIEQNNDEFILPVNYLNSEVLTVLPATPELTFQHQKQYQGKKMLTPRLFIMDTKGKKLADVGYEEFLTSLTDGIFMVDAKSVAVKPLSKEKINSLQ